MFKHYRFLILVTILALVALVIYPLGVLPIRGFTMRIINPISEEISTFVLGGKNFFHNISQINSLTKANHDLKEENLRLISESVKCQEIAHQNQILNQELGFMGQNGNQELIPVYITGRAPSGFVQELKTNKGNLDGVQQGKPVVSQGFLIGVVSGTTSHTSQIALVNSSRFLIPVILQDSRGTGLMSGGLAGLVVKEIPIDNQIKVNETVLTSGLGGDLPPGIPIGKISQIISKESEMFQQTAVDSPIDIGKLEVVFIYE